MSLEILTIAPSSGEFTEVNFGEHFNSILWVKFANKDLDEWVGCFSKTMETGLCSGMTNATNTIAFVIAGGRGYLIDLEKRKLIVELGEQAIVESAIVTSNPDYFLAGTFYAIYVLNESGLLHELRPYLIIDGIFFKNQLKDKAIGEIATAENQYERNLNFELDLNTFLLTIPDSQAN